MSTELRQAPARPSRLTGRLWYVGFAGFLGLTLLGILYTAFLLPHYTWMHRLPDPMLDPGQGVIGGWRWVFLTVADVGSFAGAARRLGPRDIGHQLLDCQSGSHIDTQASADRGRPGDPLFVGRPGCGDAPGLRYEQPSKCHNITISRQASASRAAAGLAF